MEKQSTLKFLLNFWKRTNCVMGILVFCSDYMYMDREWRLTCALLLNQGFV